MQGAIDVKYVTFDGASGLARFYSWEELIQWMEGQRAANCPVLVVKIQQV